MAKYNILDEDDIFSESGEEKSKKSKDLPEEEPEIRIDEEDLFDDSLLVEENKDEQAESDVSIPDGEKNIGAEISKEPSADGSEEKLKDFFKDDDSLEEEESIEEPDFPEETVIPISEEQKEESEFEVKPIVPSYKDETIQGLNYKPFIIGGVIILLIVVAYFIIGNGSEEPEVFQIVEEPAPQPEPQISPEQQRKNQQLAQIAGQTQHEMSFVNNIISLASQDAKVSSMLLYDKTFMVEFFGKDRADMAKLHRAMQSNLPQQKIEILASNTRVGDVGGIFSLYSLELGGGGGGSKEVTQTFKSGNEAINWVKGASQTAGTRVEVLKETSNRTRNGFKVYELEAQMAGSLDNCKSFLSRLTSASANLKIHKLNLTAVDQKSFGTSRFQLKMFIQVYV